MDILANYQFLLFAIAFFLMMVVGLPFVFKEIKKKKEAKQLINRIIPASSLTKENREKIVSLHPEGKKMYPFINKAVCVGCGTCVINCKEKDALYIINGKSTLVNPYACKCRGDCERQCPTGALRLVEYGDRVKIKIPETNDHFETNIKGLYIVGTLSGAGLIKEAINQGRAAVNDIMRDVFPGNLPEVVVVGAGPAGLSSMLSCRKFGLPVVCLEKEATANTIKNFPKKKILMAEPVELPLYGPLWVGDTTREGLLTAWERILKKTGVHITTGMRLEKVVKKEGRFVVTASGRDFTCDKVILALGNRGVPRKLGVPGEDGPNVFFNLLDAEEFAGAAVSIVGAGDSAIEASISLLQQHCRISIIVRGEGFPKAKSKNRERIERAIAEKKVSVYFNAGVRGITTQEITISAEGNIFRFANDYVFVMAGGELPFQLLEKIGISIVETEI
jgi:thioredoxin reductase (NADPH)